MGGMKLGQAGCCCSGGGGGGGTGSLPGCFCSPVPYPLTMASSNTTDTYAGNYGMFQNCTIAYQAIPSAYASLSLGTNGFISNESFPDPSNDDALFQYMLTCQYNEFALTRIYADFPLTGAAFQDAVLYTWFVGSTGNTCSPFHLDDGAPYSGSASINVTIDS